MTYDVAVRPYNVLALCAGVGGLELGIRIAEPRAVGVCYVERESAAAATLVARMEDGWLSPAPIWSDLGTFDARPWRGVVDCVASGDPCQPNSLAGRQLGEADARSARLPIGSWPDDGSGTLRHEGCAAFAGGDLPLFAPGPNDPRWADIVARAPHLEPAIRRVSDGSPGRVDRLRALGNAVFPLAAAYAWRALDARLREG